jgi:hypothetical protein
MLKIFVGFILVLALSGCELISQADDLFNGVKGTLSIGIRAPVGLSVKVQIKGAQYAGEFSDDGRGFSSKVFVRPGVYDITADAVEGFNARVSRTETTGNTTSSLPSQVRVESSTVSKIEVTYVQIAPIAP